MFQNVTWIYVKAILCIFCNNYPYFLSIISIQISTYIQLNYFVISNISVSSDWIKNVLSFHYRIFLNQKSNFGEVFCKSKLLLSLLSGTSSQVCRNMSMLLEKSPSILYAKSWFKDFVKFLGILFFLVCLCW